MIVPGRLQEAVASHEGHGVTVMVILTVDAPSVAVTTTGITPGTWTSNRRTKLPELLLAGISEIAFRGNCEVTRAKFTTL